MANEATPQVQLVTMGNIMPAAGEALAKLLEPSPTQRFFEQLAQSINTPHVGDVYRDCVRSILLRATEAGLYQEPK